MNDPAPLYHIIINTKGISGPGWIVRVQVRGKNHIAIKVFVPHPYPYSVFIQRVFWIVKWLTQGDIKIPANHLNTSIFTPELLVYNCIAWTDLFRKNKTTGDVRRYIIAVFLPDISRYIGISGIYEFQGLNKNPGGNINLGFSRIPCSLVPFKIVFDPRPIKHLSWIGHIGIDFVMPKNINGSN